jgi:hypothetical protein
VFVLRVAIGAHCDQLKKKFFQFFAQRTMATTLLFVLHGRAEVLRLHPEESNVSGSLLHRADVEHRRAA